MTWLNERQRDGGIVEVQVDGAGVAVVVRQAPLGQTQRCPCISRRPVVVCLAVHELVDRYPEYVEWLTSDHEPAGSNSRLECP